MRVEIITPDGSTVFSDDNVDMVVARALMRIGYHAESMPVGSGTENLASGIKKGDEEISIAAVFGGFLEVRDNEVHIISAKRNPESIDVERAQQARERALPDSDDAESIACGKLALQRALMRLRVAGGSHKIRNAPTERFSPAPATGRGFCKINAFIATEYHGVVRVNGELHRARLTATVPISGDPRVGIIYNATGDATPYVWHITKDTPRGIDCRGRIPYRNNPRGIF